MPVRTRQVLWVMAMAGVFAASLWALSGCSRAPVPLVGACDRPALNHDGYTLAICGVNTLDESNVWCLYVATVEGRRCRVLVETHGCGEWGLDDERSGCEDAGPSKSTI